LIFSGEKVNLNNHSVKTVTKAIASGSRFLLILLLFLIVSVAFAGSTDKANKAEKKCTVYEYKISTGSNLVYGNLIPERFSKPKRSEAVK
jgi:hypothetical protein